MRGHGVRILVLTHNYPRFHGDFSGTFIEALSEAMQAQDCRVTVITPFDVRFARRPDDHSVICHLSLRLAAALSRSGLHAQHAR